MNSKHDVQHSVQVDVDEQSTDCHNGPVECPCVSLEPALNDEEWSQVMATLRVSPREEQLMRALCCELKDQAIAERMRISIHTVRTHFERLFRKLHVNTRVGLVMCVLRVYKRVIKERQEKS